ncbi:hypothetical protein D1AOALGA4SA_7520 [Olavius algarvensis Delta 1 endosymbiont]|nr:hypothetical protein D1AOALGA4SA_7520 [Olavius algarvensis Delta 1 endosymbiont]
MKIEDLRYSIILFFSYRKCIIILSQLKKSGSDSIRSRW